MARLRALLPSIIWVLLALNAEFSQALAFTSGFNIQYNTPFNITWNDTTASSSYVIELKRSVVGMGLVSAQPFAVVNVTSRSYTWTPSTALFPGRYHFRLLSGSDAIDSSDWTLARTSDPNAVCRCAVSSPLPSPATTTTDTSKASLTAGAKAGIAVGTIVGGLAIIVGAIRLMARRGLIGDRALGEGVPDRRSCNQPHETKQHLDGQPMSEMSAIPTEYAELDAGIPDRYELASPGGMVWASPVSGMSHTQVESPVSGVSGTQVESPVTWVSNTPVEAEKDFRAGGPGSSVYR